MEGSARAHRRTVPADLRPASDATPVAIVTTLLLETAVEQFGRLGFEGASTREIARVSGTAMSSITYHFGGKRGLYLAAADFVAGAVSEWLAPAFEAMPAVNTLGRDEAITAAQGLVEAMGRMMLEAEAEQWTRFISREQQYPTEVFERLYEGVMRRVDQLLFDLVARARTDLEEYEVRAIAFLLLSQALMLRAGRASICKSLGVTQFDSRIVEVLIFRLCTNIRAILI